MSIVQIEILTLPPESIHFLQLPGNGKQQGHLWPPLSLHQWPMAQISATTTVVLKDTYPWFYNTFYRNALRGPNENVYHCFAPLVNFTFHLFIKLTFHLFIKVPGKNVSFFWHSSSFHRKCLAKKCPLLLHFSRHFPSFQKSSWQKSVLFLHLFRHFSSFHKKCLVKISAWEPGSQYSAYSAPLAVDQKQFHCFLLSSN